MSTKFQVIRSAQSNTSLKSKENADFSSSDDTSVSDDDEVADEDSDDEDEEEEEEKEEVTAEDANKDEKTNEIKNYKDSEAKTSDSISSLTFVCETLCDYTGEEPGDLSFTKGEMLTVIGLRKDGWWEAENQDGGRGLVPSTFLKVPEKIKKYLDSAQATPQHAHDQLWGKLRMGIKQLQHADTALSGFGAFPIGFCKATLSCLLLEDSRYSTEAFLAPKLSDSGLSFRDLLWSSITNSLKSVAPRLQRIIRLVAFRHIYPPTSGYTVLNHYVRICLHDGSKVLSNIHTIRAKWDPRSPKIWTFIPKVSSIGSYFEEGIFFVRSNNSSPTVGILFQLCVSYSKIATEETGEMSCGWVFMRLLDDSGLPIPSRTKVLRIHSGIPFLNDASASPGQKSGPLKFMNRVKHPRLVVTITTPKNTTTQQLNFLPTTLIESVSSIPLLVLYRKILADKLLRDRVSFESTELIQSPFLCNFPRIFSQPDLIDALRISWHEKIKTLKQIKSEKDEENRKMAFQQHFTETVFLILQFYHLKPFDLINTQVEKERKAEISRVMKLIHERGPLAIALSSEIQFHPLSINDLAVDIIGPYCQTVDGIT